jgi:hypothetical protein
MMGHHIDQLTIHSLRRLDGLHLRQLGSVNLLVGENNSGKTTVLEAVAMFCRPLDPWEWLAVARRRTIKSSRESLLDGVRWLFPQAAAELDDPYYQGQILIRGQGVFPCLEAAARFNGLGADETGTGSMGYDEADEEAFSSSAHEDNEEESAGSSGYMARGAEITLSALVPPEHRVEFNALPGTGQLFYDFALFEDERFIRREPPKGPLLTVATVSPFSHRVEQLQVSQLSEATLAAREFSVLECVNAIDPEVRGLEILSRQRIKYRSGGSRWWMRL